MRRKSLVIALVAVMVLGLAACGKKDEKTAQAPKSEATEAPEDKDEKPSKDEEKVEKKESKDKDTDDSDNTADYSAATEFDPAAVEEVAIEVKGAILSKDWDLLANLCSFPLNIDNKKVKDNVEFIDYIEGHTVKKEFTSLVKDESCHDMFARDLGVCMANGAIWLGEVKDGGEPEILVTSINGMCK